MKNPKERKVMWLYSRTKANETCDNDATKGCPLSSEIVLREPRSSIMQQDLCDVPSKIEEIRKTMSARENILK